MPELPEVETVKRILKPQLCNQKIVSLSIPNSAVLAHPEAEQFVTAVKSSIIQDIGRYGKFLIIHMKSGDSLIIHLRMTGQLLCTPADHPQKPHTHVILHLENGQELRYIDVRRFGRLWLKRKDEQDSFTGIHKLGIEAFDDAFSASYLSEKLGKRQISIKQALLDQTVVAGIGNIYSDEILFASKLSPERMSSSLSRQEWQTLADTIPEVLRQAIENNDMSAEDYLKGEGKEYRNTPFFQIYGHEKNPCPHCGSAIKRMKIAGRSSFYCPDCQL